MDLKEKKSLLQKYIDMFQNFTEDDGYYHELTDKVDKKLFRKLETKEDVLRVLTEEYLKEYKEEEQYYVDEIFKTKTEVKNLKIKKKRLDTKTKDYEKQVKSLRKDFNKISKQIDRLETTIGDRKKTSEELDSVIGIKRNQYQKKEISLKKDIQGVKGGDDEYYLNWFMVFIELQQLFDGKKVYIDNLDTYPRYRVRFFGGSGRGGFDISGRIWKDEWRKLSNKLDRLPTKQDVLPIILPKIQQDLKGFFKSDKFKTYLRKKTKPIGSGYGKYKRRHDYSLMRENLEKYLGK